MDKKIVFHGLAASLFFSLLYAETSDDSMVAWGWDRKSTSDQKEVPKQKAASKGNVKERLASLEKQMAELKQQENPSWKRASGLYFGAEALYWKTIATGVPVAGTYTTALYGNSDVQAFIQKLEFPHFNYDWGYRLLFGYDLPVRQWSLDGTWTHFSSTGKKNMNSPNIVVVWGSSGNTLSPTFVEGKDTIDLNFYDAELGKKIGFASPFSIKPHIGIRWAQLDETLNVYYGRDQITTGTGTARFKMQNDFKGIGLKAGLDATWEMAKGWAFFGRSGASLLWGTTDLTRREQYHLNDDNVITNFDENLPFKQNNMQAIVELLLGLQVDIKMAQGKVNLHFQGGYEVVYLPGFKQMGKMFTTNQNETGIATFYPGSLGFHGYNMGVRLDF